MQISKYIIIAALLGTMSLNEVQAIRLRADPAAEAEVAATKKLVEAATGKPDDKMTPEEEAAAKTANALAAEKDKAAAEAEAADKAKADALEAAKATIKEAKEKDTAAPEPKSEEEEKAELEKNVKKLETQANINKADKDFARLKKLVA